jgi:hypothetical protein
MGKRKTLLVDSIMAFIDWLRRQQERSEANRRLFEGRPMVAASEVWSGYQDSPGGQRLMVRQMQRPEVTNKLVSKNDGTQTLTKTWKDPDASVLKATGLGPGPEIHPVNLQSWPVRRSYWDSSVEDAIRDRGIAQEEGLFRPPARRGLSPEAQAAIAQVQATRGQNVDASGQPITRMSLANLGIPIRAMGDAIGRMDRSMQGIRDLIERIRRLMQHRTRNPYFPTGGRY